MSAVIGDLNYICTAYRGLNMSCSRGNVRVWTYNFAHTPHCPWVPNLSEQTVQIIGPTHTAEIPFVMGHIMPGPNCTMTSDERSLSDFLMSAWTNMAINGEPTTPDSPFSWPEFTSSQESLGINIGNNANTSSAILVPGRVDYTACAFWDQVNQVLDSEANNSSNGSNMTVGANSTGPVNSTTGPKLNYGTLRTQIRPGINIAIFSLLFLLL